MASLRFSCHKLNILSEFVHSPVTVYRKTQKRTATTPRFELSNSYFEYLAEVELPDSSNANSFLSYPLAECLNC